MSEAFVARQPIFDRKLEVFAYELLFRSGRGQQQAAVHDGDQATAQVLLNAFVEIGLEQIVGRHPAFINFTRSFIVGGGCLSLPKEKVVVEVLEDVAADPEVVESVAQLHQAGYRIALDDFVYDDSLVPLIELADIIKLDVLGLDRPALEQRLAPLRRPGLKLLAEKVESSAEYQLCHDLGFDYFQGYFFCRPTVIEGRQLPVDLQTILALLGKLQDPAFDGDELERAICQDLALSYKLLRYVNSARCSLSAKIDSIRQAIVFVGSRRIRTWAGLIMLASMKGSPREVMSSAMIRAKMCELLAGCLHYDDEETYFTVGLFSFLGTLLDCPLPEILKSLPLSAEVNEALLTGEGTLGNVLRCVLAYEAGNWDVAQCLDLQPDAVRQSYLAAIAWSSQTVSELSAA